MSKYHFKKNTLMFHKAIKSMVKYLSIFLVFVFVGHVYAADKSATTMTETKQSVSTWMRCGSGPGTPNPAVVYCRELGYQVEMVKEKGGGQHTVCVFPDGNKCDAWSFMIGKCGEEYSYCARNGYKQIIKTDGKFAFSPTYAVCVDGSTEIGNPLDLMGITDRLINQPLPESELPSPKLSLRGEVLLAPLAVLPSAFDWRNVAGGDWTTPPKDQNGCGSCWAHSAVSATEAAYNLYLGDPDYDLDLSEEYPNSDCLTNNSCCGGWHYETLELIKNGNPILSLPPGVPDEACLTYDSLWYSGGDCSCGNTGCNPLCPNEGAGICNEKPCSDRCSTSANRMITISDYVQVAEDTATIKQALIDKGPLSVCFTWNNSYWDGVVRKCHDPDAGSYGHCVTIVGYDDADGAYIVKDNYGTTSGDGTGHWRFGYGECLVETLVYYVEAADVNLPPRADANGLYSAKCAGGATEISLDGSGSTDPNGDEITYSWSSSCPGAIFDDSSSATPTLTVGTSASAVCPMDCDVTLAVSNDDWPQDTATAEVTIEDTTAPVLADVPADATFECDSVPPPALVTASDICDPAPVLVFSETRTDGTCSSNYTLTREWKATDACGNTTTATQVVTVEDTTEPVIACNAPATITPPDAPISFTSTATDNCDGAPYVEITKYDCFDFTKKGKRIDKTESCVVSVAADTITILDSGGVGDNIAWTVRATDICGNYSEKICTVEVVNPGNMP